MDELAHVSRGVGFGAFILALASPRIMTDPVADIFCLIYVSISHWQVSTNKDLNFNAQSLAAVIKAWPLSATCPIPYKCSLNSITLPVALR